MKRKQKIQTAVEPMIVNDKLISYNTLSLKSSLNYEQLRSRCNMFFTSAFHFRFKAIKKNNYIHSYFLRNYYHLFKQYEPKKCNVIKKGVLVTPCDSPLPLDISLS